MSRLVGRTVPGAPPSVDRWRRFRAPPHLRARPCVACLPRLTGCGRSAWPILPASLTALPPSSAATRIRSRASQPAHHWYGRPTLSFHPRRAGVEARPYGRHPHLTNVAPTPQSRRKAPRQLPFQGSRGVGGGLQRLRICLPRCGYVRYATARKGRRPRRPAVGLLPGLTGCRRWAWPIAPAFPASRTVTSAAPRIRSRASQPAHLLGGAAHRRRPPTHARGLRRFNLGAVLHLIWAH